MIMNKTILFLLLVLKLAYCNIFEIDVPKPNVNGVRDESSIISLLIVDLQKDAIHRIVSSLQQSRQSTKEIERVLSNTHGRRGLTDNGGRVMVVPARVDRLHVKPGVSHGVTLLASEPGSNPTEISTDTERFFIPKGVKLPFITPLIHLNPVRFLTPPTIVPSSINTNSQHSNIGSTNSFTETNNRFVSHSQPTTSPDPIFYFINNPTPFSTQVSSSHPNSNHFDTHANTNNRGISTPHPTISPNQIFYFVNRPTPPINNPVQDSPPAIGNNQIDITNIRNNIANILANNRFPNQQFDGSNMVGENHISKDITQIQPESNLDIQASISNTLQPPENSPSQGGVIQPSLSPTELNNSPPITSFTNQQFDSTNTQPESNVKIQVSTSNNLNAPQESITPGVNIQQQLTSTGLNNLPEIINPIFQKLTPPSLDLPRPESQIQQPHCLLCDLLSTSNPVPTSQKSKVVQVSSLQPKDFEALRIIVDGVLFRADPPDIGVHSSEIEDPRLIPKLQRPKESIVIHHQSTSQIKPSILSMLGSDVNMNLLL